MPVSLMPDAHFGTSFQVTKLFMSLKWTNKVCRPGMLGAVVINTTEVVSFVRCLPNLKSHPCSPASNPLTPPDTLEMNKC